MAPKPMRIAALAVLSLLLASAAAAGESSRIYVYAQRDTPARSWLPVSCGGAVAAEVRRGAYFAIELAPGQYTLGIEQGVPVSVQLRPGEDLYIRVDWHHELGRRPIAELGQVPPDQAVKEMRYLSYIDAARVHSPSVAKADPREAPRPQLKSRPER